jgi:uncharacterized protein YdhG (YjbR/CyaY superfamily)
MAGHPGPVCRICFPATLLERTEMPYQNYREYLQEQPAETQSALEQLRACILEAVPDAEECINYNIPAFALIPGGKRDQQIMIAGFKKHVGLYPHPTTMEHFSAELSSYKQGKGSVQFPLGHDLPCELIKRMVLYRKNLIDTE